MTLKNNIMVLVVALGIALLSAVGTAAPRKHEEKGRTRLGIVVRLHRGTRVGDYVLSLGRGQPYRRLRYYHRRRLHPGYLRHRVYRHKRRLHRGHSRFYFFRHRRPSLRYFHFRRHRDHKRRRKCE